MQRDLVVEYRIRPVVGIVVQERSDPGELVLHVRQALEGLARIDVVAPAHRQGDPVACGYDDARSMDLDIEFVDLAGGQRLRRVVWMERRPFGRTCRVELAVRGAQLDEAHSLTAIGPVISVSSAIGSETKVSPSPVAL